MVSQFKAKAAAYAGELGCILPLGKEKTFLQKVINGWRSYELAQSRGLQPTPYFFEALDYVAKAKKLQAASLAGKKVPKVGDPLMEAIPIYNTVERRYAGFSNVPEWLWYGKRAPKYAANLGRDIKSPRVSWEARLNTDAGELELWLYLTLVHRVTGSGASFEHDHGWRNSIVSHLGDVKSLRDAIKVVAFSKMPIFTSIGNQIPPFNKPTGQWNVGGRQYLAETAPDLCMMMAGALLTWQSQRSDPMPIKTAVDMSLRFQKALGCRQFKFVLTAWVMDMAEYLPHLVDPNSDVYHGKNAIEAMNICFVRGKMKTQDFYDKATRLFADVTGTKPMDVEDASPGCDFVRWIENYVPKKGFDHVRSGEIFNGSSLVWHAGRQPPPF